MRAVSMSKRNYRLFECGYPEGEPWRTATCVAAVLLCRIRKVRLPV